MIVCTLPPSINPTLVAMAGSEGNHKGKMKGLWFFSFSLSLFFLSLQAAEEKSDNIYVIYMGSIPHNSNSYSLRETHLQLLSSVLKREQRAEKKILRRYEHGFSGFAARLSKEEALAISKKPGVVSVFADPVYQLHTTRSWEFLQQDSSGESNSKQEYDNGLISASGSTDTIIGLLDTGIWPESKSFDDTGMSAIPTQWNGTCMKGPDFNCNKKIIGARYYNLDGLKPSTSLTDDGSPRDNLGHGTHTSSTAAGALVLNASYYGLAPGTAKGGSTTSRIAMYKVCGSSGCPGSALLAAFDDAISDHVDLISLSIGASAFFGPDFSSDPIAIGAFHAVDKGILVVCSAGNDGPSAGTVVNAAPWILTVGATTIDRHFESDVLLGANNKAIKGEAINFSNLEKSPLYPLIGGASATSNSSDTNSAAHCEFGALDASKVKGNIVLCKHSPDDTSKRLKTNFLQTSGALGAILADDSTQSKINTYIDFPVTEVSSEAANDIYTYINSIKNPVATILPSVTVKNFKPAPQVAYFSGRGPSTKTSNILKPDVGAPGVNILASWIPTNGSSEVPSGQKPMPFSLESGTSMACPHIAGVAATVKSWNPSWSPSAIKSAIMTTATQTNNDKASITTDMGSIATPFDYGAGEVNPTAVLQPGLVYEAGTLDYLQFLCNYGYPPATINLITTIPNGFNCTKNSTLDLISNLNYPSISVSNFSVKARKTVSRTVTNVGAEEATYLASVKAPTGLDVKVVPSKLQFSKIVKKLSYQVTFSAASSSVENNMFGSITWSDGTHTVRSPFVVISS